MAGRPVLIFLWWVVAFSNIMILLSGRPVQAGAGAGINPRAKRPRLILDIEKKTIQCLHRNRINRSYVSGHAVTVR